jgi:hypothetical protein
VSRSGMVENPRLQAKQVWCSPDAAVSGLFISGAERDTVLIRLVWIGKCFGTIFSTRKREKDR